MSTVADVLGQDVPGEEVEALGKVWRLAHVGPAIRARYSAWCKARAWAELAALKPLLPPESYREALAGLQEQTAARAYDWGTPLRKDAMGSGVRAQITSEEGRIKLLAELLRPAHPDVADDLSAVAELVGSAEEQFTLALVECLGLPPLPNGPAPAGKKTPTGKDPKAEKVALTGGKGHAG